MIATPNMTMKSSASLNVEDRKVLARSADTKPNSADGMNERIGLRAIDLAPHPSDVNVDDVRHGIKMKIPNVLQQHRARDNLTLVAHKVLKDLEFPRQQINFPVPTAYGS